MNRWVEWMLVSKYGWMDRDWVKTETQGKELKPNCHSLLSPSPTIIVIIVPK